MSDNPSPSLSDSDGEYHTCDEDDDDDDKVSGVWGTPSHSSSSSDDGREYYHSSDFEDEDELDVLGAAAPAVVVKKEANQLYSSKITGLDQQVQEILEACVQTERNKHPVPTSCSRQDEDKLDVARSSTRQIVPTIGSQQDENSLDVARSHTRQIVPMAGSQHDNTLVKPLARHRQLVPTLDNRSAGGGYSALVQLNVNVTQQQFGDVTVEKATNINQSFGGKQNISKTATFHEERKGAELSKSDMLMKRTLEHIEAWNQGMVKTAALSQVLDKLEKGATWLTIKGNPGEGKTTVGYMALEELHRRGRQVFCLRSPTEFFEVISTVPRPVIMLDDVFGTLEFDQSKWSSWEPVVGPLLEEREHKSHENIDFAPKKDVTVILVGRDYVLNSASRDLGRLSDFVTSDKYVVFMNHSMQRDIGEKSAIWESISRSSGVQIDKHTVDKIFRTDVAHGFPHVCRLFVTLYKENNELKAEEFFKKPLKFLNISVSHLFKDTTQLLLFKEMVRNGGSISIRDVRKLDPTYKVIQAAEIMVGSYLRIEDAFYLFDHPSIYDSVAFNLCTLDPLFVIQQCHLEFIHERVRIQMSQNSPSTPRSESSLVVYVDRTYADELAERFSTEIMKQHFYYVLSHQSFSDASFVQMVMSQVAMPLTKLPYLNDQTIVSKHRTTTFLSLVPSSKSPELLKYLDDCPDINLNEGDEQIILYETCKHAALQVLTYLIKTRSSLNINTRFDYGSFKETPLIVAAQTGDIQFIQQVLSLKPDLNAKDEDERTALHYMCENGLASLVTQMIDRGAEIDVEDCWDDNTPLCLACQCNNIEVVQLLIRRGARVDGTTLDAACRGGHLDVVKFLLEKEINLMATKSSLMSACEGGNVDVLKFLVHKGATVDTSTDYLTLLDAACVNNNPLAFEWLLKQRDVDGCPDKSRVLLKTGFSVNTHDDSGTTALQTAAQWGAKECVEMLLKAGATVNLKNQFGNNALHRAAGSGSEECVYLLLKAGVQVNLQNEDGNTPLHRAAGKISKECTDLLLTAGAVVNIQNKNGNTALHTATFAGSLEYVDVFLASGASVNTQNTNGNTPLHIAVNPRKIISPDESVCRELIKRGADVNTQNADGNTPLHLLSSFQDYAKDDEDLVSGDLIDIIKALKSLLISAGADVNIQNKKGKPALCETVTENTV